MQLISVERWTFWTAVVLAVLGPVLNSVVGPMFSLGQGTYVVTEGLFSGPLLVLLLVSVVLDGSRDPSVRRVPAQPQT